MDGSNQSMFFPQMQHYQSYGQQMMNSQMGCIDQKPVGLVDQFGMDPQVVNTAGKKPAKPSKKKKKAKESVTIKTEGDGTDKKNLKQQKITEHLTVRKKRDRFNGMPEEDVVKRTLPDHLAENLDIVIIGINPGLFAAYVGHHYAGPGNHFWKCLYLSGMIPEPMNAYDDAQLLDFGIGFTNIVGRTTRGSADLKKEEIKEGAEILKSKLIKYKPKIAVFNGKGIYEVFLGHKNFYFGKQPAVLEGSNTVVYVMPSSSARCAQLPRAVDKLPFFTALKKLRDHMRGDIQLADDSEVTFPDLELKVFKVEKVEPVEGDNNPQPPVSKKKKKKSTPSKAPVLAENAAASQGSMWPAVKQENGFNPADYGQMSAVDNHVSTAASAAHSHAKSVYKNVLDMNYAQANGLSTQSSGVGVPHTTANCSTSGNGVTFYQNSDLHTLQPMQQFFSQGSFLQQLQTPLLPEQSQGMQFSNGPNWQQFGGHPFYQNLTMNQMLPHGHPNAGFPGFPGQQNMQQPAPAHQQPSQMPLPTVKAEPQSTGYENVPANNSCHIKQQEIQKQPQQQQQQQQCLTQNQPPPPLQHMQQQHQSFQQNQNQHGYFPQMHQAQKEQTEMSVVKSEPRESGYECALSGPSSVVEKLQGQTSPSHDQLPQQQQLQLQHRSPTQTNQNQQEPPPLTHMQPLVEQTPNQQAFVPQMQQHQQQLGFRVKTEPKEQGFDCTMSCSQPSRGQEQPGQNSSQQPQQQQQQQQPHSPTQLPFTVKSEPQDQGYDCAMNKNSN
ncbi:probable serine/threonine-protein kinase tsuA [Gigantopelta aegis]|uniref:probable serine/threonine-protein kinase tsuA n=1 Tax=Gigantopelta aegis TaxID=1735272 RepID=UPI001B88AE13|nr:probable serine/threonine-protein kinase tsuA [Gigantopelta aegis]